jgi:hypothetical protein
MIRYTARNGTTFQMDDGECRLHVTSAHDEESAIGIDIDLDDLREFLEHLDQKTDAPTDADAAAVSAD